MSGEHLAHYEILELLGKGGMGEVHRALDTKLNREVALKLLPEELAQDIERMARFRREAQVLASLNHPNIAGIHGLEEADGKSFLVMELAEGEDLEQRLRGGALGLDESIAIARQIAQGLEEAHEKNIVHRDLKPANVMVSRDGKVKILDFGLARAYSGDPLNEGDPSTSPTITAAMTQVGTILGSAAYMSPEQAKGREVDRRADIWAFGVVLFEMLTGRTLFEAETVSETMACVMKEPIDWERLPEDLPPGIRMLLDRCLERDPSQRLRDIGEARIFLQDPKGSGSFLGTASSIVPGDDTTPAASKGSILPWILFGASVLALVAILISGGLTGGDDASPGEERVWRASLEAPPERGFHLSGANPSAAVISPDGTTVVYGARDQDGVNHLWLQRLEDAEPVPLPGTESAQYPFWSPDSRSIAYFANGELRALNLDNRTDRPVANASDGKGGAWLEDDTILFTESSTSPISRVPVGGGEVTRLTDLAAEPRSNSHRLPRPLPGGRYFLFAARKDSPTPEEPVAIMLGDLEGGPPRELLTFQSHAEYANGHLLYLVDNALYARPFDLTALEFTGPPSQLATEVGSIPGAALSLFSVSQSGELIYHSGYRETMKAHLAWYDLEGERVGELGDPSGFGRFDISPDGERVAFAAFDNRTGMGDLWLHDVESGVRTRLTFESTDESSPLWSPDGKTIYYTWSNGTDSAIYSLEPDGREEPRLVHVTSNLNGVGSVSPDGRHLSYSASDTLTGEIRSYVLALDGSGEADLIDADAAQTLMPQFSPDGRWIAYASLETGQWGIYLKTFPLSGRKWQLSDRPALWYDWDPEGNRICHQWSGGEVFVTDLELSGAHPRIGKTELLMSGFPSPLTSLHQFQVSPDGTQLLVSDSGGSEDTRPIRLVVGWPRLLENR